MRRTLTRYTILILGILLALTIILVGSIEVTSTPKFCSTCHYMEPYVKAWQESTHADVTCTDCHFPPGIKSKIRGKFTAISMVANYMTGIYKKSKPWAEISDESCLRKGCHVKRLLTGKVIFKEGIIFDHLPHLTNLRRGKKLRCTSCHSQIVQGEHISVTETTCFLCHFKEVAESGKINQCTWCHDAPVPNSENTISYDHSFILEQKMDCQKCHGKMQVGDGTVPRERCEGCHADKSMIAKYDDGELIHKVHVTDHKVECQNCHLSIQHKSVAKTNDIIPPCSSCHENSHRPQLSLFTGTGGKDVPDRPNPMFTNGLNCQACHIFHEMENEFEELGDVYKASSESCDICHGEGYNLILTQWKTLLGKKIQNLDSLYLSTESLFAKSTGLDQIVRDDVRSLLDDARYNFQLVKVGNIVHNVEYSDELLMKAINNLSRATDQIDPDLKIPDFSQYGSMTIPDECSNCHYGIEDVRVNVFNVNFLHRPHITDAGLFCFDCHSNKKKHGELIINASKCTDCHHTLEVIPCKKCHDIQYGVYSGSIISDQDEADPMFTEEVSCTDCHYDEDGLVTRDVADNCINCHDEEYSYTLDEMQSTVRNLLDEITLLRSATSVKVSESENAGLDADELKIYQSLLKDGSSGAHNYELIVEKLTDLRDKLQNNIH